MNKYNNVNQQDAYSHNNHPEKNRKRLWLLAIPIILLLFIIYWLIFPHFLIKVVPVEVEKKVEVTRIVTENKEIHISKEVPVEVTRIFEVPVEVTQIVSKEIPVEATRVVTVVEEIEVTRIVEYYILQLLSAEDVACARFNLEVGRDRVRGTHGFGLYEMRELSGNVIATWQAADGALDSDWLQTSGLSQDTSYIEVFFTPTGSSQVIQLEIVNPAPNATYGWLTRGMCHAIEIQFWVSPIFVQ